MRTVKVGLLQLESRLLDISGNLQRAGRAMRRAAGLGADIVCLPELFASGYDLARMGGQIRDLAEPAGSGAVTGRLCQLAKELHLYVAAGVPLRTADGRCCNSAVFINEDGTLQGVYHKNHLFGAEKTLFQPGNGYRVFHTRFGTVGVLICYDNNFPESVRELTLMGAELILVLCAWRVQDRDLFELLSASHAAENTVFLGACNLYYDSADLQLFGGSRLLNPRGQILAESIARGEDVIVGEVDLDRLAQWRMDMPVLQDRRPALLRAMTAQR